MSREIEFARIGNPWIVGRYANRIVPLYLIHNVIAPEFEKNGELQQIKNLVVSPQAAKADVLSNRISVPDEHLEELKDTVAGLLSPDRRVFQDRKKGGASEIGSVFPFFGALTGRAPSDDGLGDRLRGLMERHSTDWRTRLISLMAPDTVHDPASLFALTLAATTGNQVEHKPQGKVTKLRGLDLHCATFVDNLIRPVSDATRLTTIRALAIGAYLIAIIRMVAGPISEYNGNVPLVFVYGGVPPGDSKAPLVRAAAQSFQSWVSASWRATGELISRRMAAVTTLPRATIRERKRQQLTLLLKERIPAPATVNKLLDTLSSELETPQSGTEWCLDVLQTALTLPVSELVRRVRSMGGNIGFAGPDRGIGAPRLLFDTPLLGVLVEGILGDNNTMEFRDFVTALSSRFGLVLGPGSDDSITDQVAKGGVNGHDFYNLLVENEDLFRDRLLRVGLARAYSDSHTEVSRDV